MKVITKTTISVGKAPAVESLAPGVHELDDGLATWLLKRGKADLAEKAPAEPAEVKDDKPQAEQPEKPAEKAPADDKQSRGQSTGRR